MNKKAVDYAILLMIVVIISLIFTVITIFKKATPKK